MMGIILEERTSKTGRTASKEVRRRQLIDAAMETIAEKGLSGATTANVTKRAGLSAGIVSLHFDSKENLLIETLRHLSDELQATWAAAYQDDTLTAPEKLHEIIGAIFHPRVCTPTKTAVWFAFFGDAHYREIYRDMVGDSDDKRTDAIEDLCEQVKIEGGYHHVDAEALSVAIEGMADGMWLCLMLYPEWDTPTELALRVTNLLAAYFPNHFTAAPVKGADCGR